MTNRWLLVAKPTRLAEASVEVLAKVDRCASLSQYDSQLAQERYHGQLSGCTLRSARNVHLF